MRVPHVHGRFFNIYYIRKKTLLTNKMGVCKLIKHVPT